MIGRGHVACARGEDGNQTAIGRSRRLLCGAMRCGQSAGGRHVIGGRTGRTSVEASADDGMRAAHSTLHRGWEAR